MTVQLYLAYNYLKLHLVIKIFLVTKKIIPVSGSNLLLNSNEYEKYKKNWCIVTVARTMEHHGGHWRTPKKSEVRPGGREESASSAWLAASAMNARDSTKGIHAYGGLTLDLVRHYIGSVTATETKLLLIDVYYRKKKCK